MVIIFEFTLKLNSFCLKGFKRFVYLTNRVGTNTILLLRLILFVVAANSLYSICRVKASLHSENNVTVGET